LEEEAKEMGASMEDAFDEDFLRHFLETNDLEIVVKRGGENPFAKNYGFRAFAAGKLFTLSSKLVGDFKYCAIMDVFAENDRVNFSIKVCAPSPLHRLVA
jgi:hypothetical protein